MPASKRPLSPHLTIYRKQISSVLSILHRATGVALFGGVLLIVVWLAIAAYAPAEYTHFFAIVSSPLGRIALLGWTFCFYYHFCNGIRHLFWDVGLGFTLPVMHRSGYAVLYFATFFTSATWAWAFSIMSQTVAE